MVIAVDQRRLVAVWQHAGRSLVVDSDGAPLPRPIRLQFASLPLVVGEGANAAAAAILPAVCAARALPSAWRPWCGWTIAAGTCG